MLNKTCIKSLIISICLALIMVLSSCESLDNNEISITHATDAPTEIEVTATPEINEIIEAQELNIIDIAVKLNLNNIRDFVDGKAAAQNSSGLWGFVDNTGEWVIEPKYDFVGDFSEKMAIVGYASSGDKSDIDQWGFINDAGEVIVSPRYKYAYSFSNGLAYVGDNSCTYYIDYEGNVVLSSDDYEGYIFDGNFNDDGTAIIYGMTEIDGVRTSYCGIINKEGELLLDGYELNLADISEAFGNFRVAETNVLKSGSADVGVINSYGEWVIVPVYYDIAIINEEMAVVSVLELGTIKSGIMSLDGQWISELGEAHIRDFGYNMMVYYTMEEPQKMELFDYEGNILLQGESYQEIVIKGEEIVVCKKDDSSLYELLWSDGTYVMAGSDAFNGYYLNNYLVAVKVIMDDVEVIGIIDIHNPDEWLIEPKYDRIIELNDNSFVASIVIAENENQENLTFIYETIDNLGNITAVSQEVTFTYETYKNVFSIEHIY